MLQTQKLCIAFSNVAGSLIRISTLSSLRPIDSRIFNMYVTYIPVEGVISIYIENPRNYVRDVCTWRHTTA